MSAVCSAKLKILVLSSFVVMFSNIVENLLQWVKGHCRFFDPDLQLYMAEVDVSSRELQIKARHIILFAFYLDVSYYINVFIV